MDMNKIPFGEIIAAHVDLQPINLAIESRAEALGEQMSPEASVQFVSDMKSIECTVSGSGSSLSFQTKPKESYLLNYLKEHGTPKAGGENGTAHNVDGSTYKSAVNPNLWGTELPWFELPVLDGNDEAMHIVEIMASDAGQSAASNSHDDILSAVAPEVKKETVNLFGGVFT